MGKKKSKQRGSTANQSSNSRTEAVPPKISRNTVLLALLAVAIVLSAIISVIYNDTMLKKYGEDANAIIYKLGTSGKYGNIRNIKYKYIVDGIEYKGVGIRYPDSDTFSVGDTVIIVYNNKKPTRSKTKRDLNRW